MQQISCSVCTILELGIEIVVIVAKTEFQQNVGESIYILYKMSNNIDWSYFPNW